MPATDNRYAERRGRLRQLLQGQATDALLVTNFTNVTYLTGFRGDDSYLLVSHDGDLMFSDPRYEEQLAEECPGLPVHIRKPGEVLLDIVCQKLRKLKLSRLSLEGDSVTANTFFRLQEDAGVGELGRGEGLVEGLRAVKDAAEVSVLRRAVEIAERAFLSVRAQLHSRQSELEVAYELERVIRQLGGSGCSFRTSVAVGPRAALPHAAPGERPIGSASSVLIDWGAVYQGYRSDLTRVLLTSKIPPKFTKAYGAVLAAQKAAISAMRPGVLVSEIDRVARDEIAQAGMGKRFNHGLGHGIGLDIHEAPRLGKNFDRPLEAGMVVTVEPGVYYPGWGGVRIEDDVLITPEGCEVLSALPREMEDNRVELLA